MRCPACGVRVIDEAVYCHRCGTRLEQEASPDESDYSHGQRERIRGRDAPGDRFDDPEETLWEGTVSWKGMIREFCLAVVLSVVAVAVKVLALPDTGSILIVVAILAALWLLVFLWLGYRKLNVRYEITSQRLVHKHGILYRITDRIEMIDVDDVRVAEGILQRLVGTGTIHIRSSDRTHPEIYIRGIDHIREVGQMIDDARRKERVRRGLHIESV